MFELRLSEKMLLALLRSSLHQEKADTAFFSNVSSNDWRRLAYLDGNASLVGLRWHDRSSTLCLVHPLYALLLFQCTEMSEAVW